MQDDPAIFMKTRGRATECRSINHTFLIKLDRILRQYGRFSSLAETIIAGRVTFETSPPYGHWAAKRIPFYTFEAGMCMKTKDHMTKRPNRNRHFGLKFRLFSITEALFCTKMQICGDNLLRHSSFLQVSTGAEKWAAEVARGRSARPALRPCGFWLIAARGKSRRASERALRYAPGRPGGRVGVDLKRC